MKANGTASDEFVIFTVRVMEDISQPDGVFVRKLTENKMKMNRKTDLGAAFRQFCTMHNLERKNLVFSFDSKEIDDTQTPDKLQLKEQDLITVSIKKDGPLHSTFSSDFRALLSEGLFSDVTIVVKGEKDEQTFQCHRAVLGARCTKFRTMLADSPATVEVQSNPSTYYLMLEYIYTDFTAPDDTNTLELLSLADEYMLPRLKFICERQLVNIINGENVAAILVHAHQCNATELKDRCCRVILENQTMLQSPEFQKTIRSPDLLFELLQLFAKHSTFSSESSSPGSSTPPTKKRKT